MQQKSISERRRARGMPFFGDIKSGANGELTFEVTIRPDMLDRTMRLVQAFTGQLKTRDFWADQYRKETLDYASGRIEARARRRMSLSIYRRTGNVAMAARAGGWGMFDMRYFIRDASVTENRARKRARNIRIMALRESGLSFRSIADLVDIGPGQICRIVNSG